jgi:predicted metal-dependent hydrolase
MGREVAYTLRHSRRKTLGMSVDARGLRVAAPLRMTQRHIDAFILGHRDWVLRTLDAWATRPAPNTLIIEDGCLLPVLGMPCRLQLSRGRSSVRWIEPEEAGGERVLALSCTARQSVHRAALAALEARALTDFAGRVARDALRIGRRAPPVGLTRARTRWGSCSARGIRLHWRLIHLDPALIDYVVAHEVAHLVHMNHSPDFWSVVEQLYPGASAARRRLRDAGRQLPELIDLPPA